MKMLAATLRELFDRDLEKLGKEISLFKNEACLWKTSGAIPNSAGNLCLHLVGNLNTYIAAGLNDSGYIRNRDEEFSLKNIPASALLKMIEDTRSEVAASLLKLTPTDLERLYPPGIYDASVSVGHFLVHLLAHLGYHLGQINYHRRMLDF